MFVQVNSTIGVSAWASTLARKLAAVISQYEVNIVVEIYRMVVL